MLAEPLDTGKYRCFELQDRIETVMKELEQLQSTLRDRERDFQKLAREQEAAALYDVDQMATIMKAQNNLDIDRKVLMQMRQTRIPQICMTFLHDEVHEILVELQKEFGWDVIKTYDVKTDVVAEKSDITELVISRLNDKYRAKQRAKKFSENIKQDSSSKKEAVKKS